MVASRPAAADSILDKGIIRSEGGTGRDFGCESSFYLGEDYAFIRDWALYKHWDRDPALVIFEVAEAELNNCRHNLTFPNASPAWRTLVENSRRKNTHLTEAADDLQWIYGPIAKFNPEFLDLPHWTPMPHDPLKFQLALKNATAIRLFNASIVGLVLLNPADKKSVGMRPIPKLEDETEFPSLSASEPEDPRYRLQLFDQSIFAEGKGFGKPQTMRPELTIS